MSYKTLRLIVLFLVFCLTLFSVKAADAEDMSNNWRNLLEKRSSLIFTESIDLGGLRIGGRGKIMFVWIDRSLIGAFEKDKDVDDTIVNGLDYYYSNKKEVSRLLKNRDVFLLSYHAIKRWDFKIEEIVINGYRLTIDDILTPPHHRFLGEIVPLKMRERIAEEDEDMDDYLLYVAVPSMPRSGKVKLSYGDDTIEWEIPRR